jgi:hypothetical protein
VVKAWSGVRSEVVTYIDFQNRLASPLIHRRRESIVTLSEPVGHCEQNMVIQKS